MAKTYTHLTKTCSIHDVSCKWGYLKIFKGTRNLYKYVNNTVKSGFRLVMSFLKFKALHVIQKLPYCVFGLQTVVTNVEQDKKTIDEQLQ